MKTAFLIEPVDVLFFRDAIPMGAGVGKGAGCRLPYPNTLHEAIRSTLLIEFGKVANGKSIPGRPRNAIRKGNWHSESDQTDTLIASKEFRSLCVAGPFPYLKNKGMLLPIPLDAMSQKSADSARPGAEAVKIKKLELLWNKDLIYNTGSDDEFSPRCIPVAVTPPDKKGQLKGWWTVSQYQAYLNGRTDIDFTSTPTDELYKPEYRVGVQIAPDTFASLEGRIYAGVYLRAHRDFRILCYVDLKNGDQQEHNQLAKLDWLLIGGEHRMARVEQVDVDDVIRKSDIFSPPVPPETDKPVLLKWTLATPALFAHGVLPGWCADTKNRNWSMGKVCLDLNGEAFLVSWAVGKPIVFSGFDVVEGRAKDTLLGVPAGSVYYFLCKTRNAAVELAKKLHWRPRSDYYGEKGFGYGFVSFDVKLHQTSGDVTEMAENIFKQ